jgi:hypothetical protein
MAIKMGSNRSLRHTRPRIHPYPTVPPDHHHRFPVQIIISARLSMKKIPMRIQSQSPLREHPPPLVETPTPSLHPNGIFRPIFHPVVATSLDIRCLQDNRYYTHVVATDSAVDPFLGVLFCPHVGPTSLDIRCLQDNRYYTHVVATRSGIQRFQVNFGRVIGCPSVYLASVGLSRGVFLHVGGYTYIIFGSANIEYLWSYAPTPHPPSVVFKTTAKLRLKETFRQTASKRKGLFQCGPARTTPHPLSSRQPPNCV